MARLAFWGPVTPADSGLSTTEDITQRNNVYGNGPGWAAPSIAATIVGSSLRPGAVDNVTANRKTLYVRMKIRVKRLPSVDKSFCFSGSSGEAGPGVVFYVDAAGTLSAYN